MAGSPAGGSRLSTVVINRSTSAPRSREAAPAALPGWHGTKRSVPAGIRSMRAAITWRSTRLVRSADDGVADRLGDNKTDPRRLTRTRVGRVGMHHDEAVPSLAGCPGVPEHGREISARAQPMTRREHAPDL